MTDKDRAKTLKLINKALKEFPKVLRQKELAYQEKEKVLKSFMPMAKDLKKQVEKKCKVKETVGKESRKQRKHPSLADLSTWTIFPEEPFAKLLCQRIGRIRKGQHPSN
jgi:hypothetical protein